VIFVLARITSAATRYGWIASTTLTCLSWGRTISPTDKQRAIIALQNWVRVIKQGHKPSIYLIRLAGWSDFQELVKDSNLMIEYLKQANKTEFLTYCEPHIELLNGLKTKEQFIACKHEVTMLDIAKEPHLFDSSMRMLWRTCPCDLCKEMSNADQAGCESSQGIDRSDDAIGLSDYHDN
jgi:hypothetical protein